MESVDIVRESDENVVGQVPNTQACSSNGAVGPRSRLITLKRLQQQRKKGWESKVSAYSRIYLACRSSNVFCKL